MSLKKWKIIYDLNNDSNTDDSNNNQDDKEIIIQETWGKWRVGGENPIKLNRGRPYKQR